MPDAHATNAGQPGTLIRLVNALVALTLASLALAAYWPMTKLIDLHRADLGIRGEWIGGHAKRITHVTPNGVANVAGLRVGDVLLFDPREDDHWILAGYRNMPEGFTARVPVQQANGSHVLLLLVPDRVPYLPGLNDVLAMLANLATTSVVILLGVVLIWARPGLMTWSLFLAYFSALPYYSWITYLLAFETGRTLEFWSIVGSLFLCSVIAVLPFALCFPRNYIPGWVAWKQVLVAALCVVAIVSLAMQLHVVPFERDLFSFGGGRIRLVQAVFVPILLLAVLALIRTYRADDAPTRARLRWVMLGMIAALVGVVVAIVFGLAPRLASGAVSSEAYTATRWLMALCTGILFPIALGIAVLRERVVDIQFAVSRTVVYGTVSTLVLVTLAALHWVLGKMIEETHLAIGIEGVVAVGLGLVLNRVTEATNHFADRTLFRRRHAAEKHLQRMIAALPLTSHFRAIGEALVTEPARELDLASAAIFYRQAATGSLRRLMSEGWNEDHATSLDPDCLLVRSLQAEHAPLRIDHRELLPDDVPQGTALPVLAIPVESLRVLRAVVLYGSHHNSTLPDPDEVALLQRIARAAEASHQQVRIATLTREGEERQARIGQLERSIEELRALVRKRSAIP